MANTYTPNIALAQPASGDRTWNTPLNANCSTLDNLAPVGYLNVTTTETPSASLSIHVAAGQYVKQDGTIGTYNGATAQAMPSSSTAVLYLDGTNSWALTYAASYPTTPHVRLATVSTGPSTVVAITDNRQCFMVCGSIADGVNLTLGTTTGTQIATAANQKLGFYGATPVVRPTMGAATAGASYTSTEQSMLQAVYNAVRTLGLGS
jgi:hypothetical protein